MDVKVGDWVKFYNQGRLVIACVEYIGNDGRPYYHTTDRGVVREDRVLEVRSAKQIGAKGACRHGPVDQCSRCAP